MNSKIKIFVAKNIITMNPVIPEARAVAVKNGRILGVGKTPDELKGWGDYTIDKTFEKKILLPGLIEAHSHSMSGELWKFPYIGYFDRIGPDGRLWKACKTFEAIIERLKEFDAAMSDPDESLIAWGMDPIYFPGDRLSAVHLDQVSKNRPIFVLHASAHLATVNSALMKKQGIDENTNVEGVPKGANGKPIGELQEMEAIRLAGDFKLKTMISNRDPQAWKNFGLLAHNAGCTTITDLAFMGLDRNAVSFLQSVVDDPDYPARVSIPAAVLHGGKEIMEDDTALDQMAMDVLSLGKQSSEKLRLGQVKFLLDGSIQGFTACLQPPGYLGRSDEGIWITPPEVFEKMMLPFHKNGITIHCHCNGDKAVDVLINAVEKAQTLAYQPDHRHTVQHCQLTRIDQYQKMAKLGICANIFSNHIYYWGDQHYTTTVGPDRAERMEACATAKKLGIHFTLHSDEPVTPMGQLHTAWCAVNRVTSSGRVLGDYEKISVYDAIYAVTMDAAYTLKLDHELGSIEPGKLADFTVLEANPLEEPQESLKDILIWGTVVGGKPFPSIRRK